MALLTESAALWCDFPLDWFACKPNWSEFNHKLSAAFVRHWKTSLHEFGARQLNVRGKGRQSPSLCLRSLNKVRCHIHKTEFLFRQIVNFHCHIRPAEPVSAIKWPNRVYIHQATHCLGPAPCNALKINSKSARELRVVILLLPPRK